MIEHPITEANFENISKALEYFESHRAELLKELADFPLMLHYGRYHSVCATEEDFDNFLVDLKKKLTDFQGE